MSLYNRRGCALGDFPILVTGSEMARNGELPEIPRRCSVINRSRKAFHPLSLSLRPPEACRPVPQRLHRSRQPSTCWPISSSASASKSRCARAHSHHISTCAQRRAAACATKYPSEWHAHETDDRAHSAHNGKAVVQRFLHVDHQIWQCGQANQGTPETLRGVRSERGPTELGVVTAHTYGGDQFVFYCSSVLCQSLRWFQERSLRPSPTGHL